MPNMDPYFVREYTLNNGEKVVPNAIYQDYKDAEDALENFRDIDNVEFMKIEKRYSKDKIWCA